MRVGRLYLAHPLGERSPYEWKRTVILLGWEGCFLLWTGLYKSGRPGEYERRVKFTRVKGESSTDRYLFVRRLHGPAVFPDPRYADVRRVGMRGAERWGVYGRLDGQ